MSQADDPRANYWARDEGRSAGAGLRSAAAGGCRVGSGIFTRTSIRAECIWTMSRFNSSAPGLGRGRQRWALSTLRFAERWVRDRPVSSSQPAGSRSRSFASFAATSQVREPLSRLSALLPRRKIAKLRWLQHQHKSRPESGASVNQSFRWG